MHRRELQIRVVHGVAQNAGYPSGLMSVRLFNDSEPLVNGLGKLVNTTTMSWGRWYATATLLPSGTVMIMGGTQVGLKLFN